jgi:CRISPR/Cas system-associated exonuclease Cas4 (RecB family)
MSLSLDLQLSQGSLQDFVDCRRRFQLRHVLRQAWPAVATEPALESERHVRQGEAFHRMIQQNLMGVPAARLSQMAAAAPADADLARWWHHYVTSAPAHESLAGARLPEVVLSAPLANYVLIAKYDLLVIDPRRRAIIFDWKTTRKRAGRTWLANRLQTRLYAYLLVEAGTYLNDGQPLAPDQVEMIYWFANYPDQPERFVYNADLHRENAQYLTALVDEIERLAASDEIWPLTPATERCRFCVYRSLCNRGQQAGQLHELEDELEDSVGSVVDIDFEQIAEVVY